MGYGYCVLAMAAWTVLAFVYRLAEKRQGNRFFMSAAMAGTALALDLAVAAAWGKDLRQAHVSQFVLGSALGICALVNIVSFLAALRRGDLSITWTVLTLSFAPTSLLCLFFPGERPSSAGVAGLVLAALAVSLLGLDMASRHRQTTVAKAQRGWGFYMTIAFVTNLASLYCFSLAGHFAPPDESGLKSSVHNLAFLATTYAVFGLSSLACGLAIRTGGSVRAGLATGSPAGAAMFLGGLFTLLGFLEGVPGYVLFPVTNGGSNVLVVALSVLLLKERPSAYGWLGIVAGVAALVLLGAAA